MSFSQGYGATGVNSAVDESLRDPAGIRLRLLNWLTQRGADPFRNPYAARLLGRSDEVASLMDLYKIADPTRQGFIDAWASSQWGGGQGGQASGQASPWDFSRGGVQGRIGQGEFFRTGDPAQDAQLWREYSAIANRTLGDRWSQTLDRLEQQKALSYQSWLQQNPGYSGYYADWRGGQGQPPTGFTPPAWNPSAAPPSAATMPTATAKPGGTPVASPGVGGTNGMEGTWTAPASGAKPPATTAPSPLADWQRLAGVGAAPSVGVETMPGSRLPDQWQARPGAGEWEGLNRGPATATQATADFAKLHGGGVAAPQAGARAGTAADFGDPGGLDIYNRLTDADVAAFLAAAQGRGSSAPLGRALSLGGVAYDPAQDQYRHSWAAGLPQDRQYSGGQHLINFYNDAIVRGWDPKTALAQALARMNRVFAGGVDRKSGRSVGLRAA